MSAPRVTFDRGAKWIGLFLLVVAGYLVATRFVGDALAVGPTNPATGTSLVESGVRLVALLGIGWMFLRSEGVSLGDIGLSLDRVGPAVVAVSAFYAALNLAGFGLATVTVGGSAIGYQWSVAPTVAVVAFLSQLVLAGVTEELLFRGYLQSKVIAVLPTELRFESVIGVAAAASLFVLAHVPRVLTDGVPAVGALAAYGVLLLASGMAFGLVYEYTQNLTIPILLHGAGNMPGTMGIVFFDSTAFQGGAFVAYVFAYLALAVGLVVGYRRWGIERLGLRTWTDRDSLVTSS
jgi:membrane protease YdiL (CAAX protease family)